MIAIRFGLHPWFDLRFGLQFDVRRSLEGAGIRPPLDGFVIAYVLLCLALFVLTLWK